MGILNLVNRLAVQTPEFLHPIYNSEPLIRESFLYGLGLLAQVDRLLNDNELVLFEAIAEGLDISRERARKIMSLAAQPTMEEGKLMVERLRESHLKYYLILDMRIMAHQDGCLCDAEQQFMKQMAKMLQIDTQDYEDLIELADAVFDSGTEVRRRWEQKRHERLLKTGLDEKKLSHYFHP